MFVRGTTEVFPNSAGGKDVGCLRRLKWSEVVHSVIECRDPAQLMGICTPDNEGIPSAEVFPNGLRPISFNHLFRGGNAVLAVNDLEFALCHFRFAGRLLL